MKPADEGDQTVGMDWVSVALEEYRTLRQESLSAIEQMQRTLQIGLVAIGVITGFGVDAADSPPALQAGLAGATPAFAALVMVMWLDELRRAVFAGAQVARVEHKIAQRYPGDEPPLVWETQIQETYDPEAGYSYLRHWATTAALFAATVPIVGASLFRLQRDDEWALFGIAAAAVVAVVALMVVHQAGVHRDMSDIHRDAQKAIGISPGAVESLPGQPLPIEDRPERPDSPTGGSP